MSILVERLFLAVSLGCLRFVIVVFLYHTHLLLLLNDRSVANRHRCHMTSKCGMFVDKNHDKLPTLYWLPKLHKTPYKDNINFIANSSSCITSELSKFSTVCHTIIKTYKSGEVLNILISKGFLEEE